MGICPWIGNYSSNLWGFEKFWGEIAFLHQHSAPISNVLSRAYLARTTKDYDKTVVL